MSGKFFKHFTKHLAARFGRFKFRHDSELHKIQIRFKVRKSEIRLVHILHLK